MEGGGWGWKEGGRGKVVRDSLVRGLRVRLVGGCSFGVLAVGR